MPKLSFYARQRIVVLAIDHSYRKIKQELAKESIKVSILGIHRSLKKYHQTKLLNRKKKWKVSFVEQ